MVLDWESSRQHDAVSLHKGTLPSVANVSSLCWVLCFGPFLTFSVQPTL